MKMKIKIDKKRFLFYVWLGLIYLAIWLLIEAAENPDTFFKRAWNNIWLISYLVVFNFVLFEYTLPSIKMSIKGILRALPLFAVHLLFLSFGLYFWRMAGIQLGLYFPLVEHATLIAGVTTLCPYGIFSILVSGILKHLYDHKKLREAAQQLRIEKQEAELNYLKSQTNPHFLFNTLNNIYSLARDKSDLAPESILRLSKILRFMLYEAGGEFISVEQELKIISDYIALEELRYDESLRINFNYDVEDMKQSIPPLLLIPMVENAFKHGASETRSLPFVDIHLSIKNRRLLLIIKNSSEAAAAGGIKENIGLSNLRRQLELLYTDYELLAQQGDSVFTASLKINLASHV